jgi:hypothetical protein
MAEARRRLAECDQVRDARAGRLEDRRGAVRRAVVDDQYILRFARELLPGEARQGAL